MGISDMIAAYIIESLNEMNGVFELQRGELAQKFNCVPSQINYVISTRFLPKHGYIVESRRGGGGYIRITRVLLDKKSIVLRTINAVGDELDAQTAAVFLSNLKLSGAISDEHSHIIAAATSDRAVKPAPPEIKNMVRANIFKQVLINCFQ